uniref:Peptidase aspartic putative domain-containing protein n=1 Tax=Anopheles dirus TaxID=7168 RepID=A0A182NCC2_9DIPT
MTAQEWRPADHIAARQVWPKKLPSFSGKPRDWPKFYSYFVESTKACALSPAENMARLEECLTGPARDSVEGWLDCPTSVPLVIKTLKRLYGRPSLVVKDLLDKVRRIPAPRPEQLDELITFGLAVLHLCHHFNNADLAQYLSNPELLDDLEISARGDERRYSIAAAHTVDQLSLPNRQINFPSLISSYDYLQDVPVERDEEEVPRILIGLENVDLMTPLETRSGQPGQPIAVKTVLGWAIYGPHQTTTTSRQPMMSNVHCITTTRDEQHPQLPPARQQVNEESDVVLNEMLRQYFTLEEAT